MNNIFSYVNPRQNMRGFVIGILILAGLGMAAGAAVVTTQPPREVPIEEISTDRFSSPNILVYSYWAGDKSEIKSYDLSNGQEKLLATLPLNVKHVNLLSSSEIIYINETDDRDHGSSIVTKTIPDGAETVVVTADSDVRIDDYRVSQNGLYVATWEVALAPDTNQLFNGTSRVYVTNINTGQKNQIYSETANVPVHYPVGVTNDGKVFMDTFLPNDNAGWSYGMSVSDFSGQNIQDITAVANGTYGSQPVMSPDGTMLVFAGYDGSKGGGTEIVSDVRRAILSSNTIDILDVNTLSRRRLAGLSSENYYSRAWWDGITGNVIFSQSSRDSNQTGNFAYSLGTNIAEKINAAPNPKGPQKALAVLSPGISLFGNVTTSESTLGNLGGHYEQVLDGVYIYNENNNEIINLDITEGFVQPVSVKPSSFFAGTSISSLDVASADQSGGIRGQTPEQLQLQTFTIKPTLAPVRNEQQSGERCRDVAAAACNELLGTDFTGDQARGGQTGNTEYQACFTEQFSAAKTAGCANSPLYLYGKKGDSVAVTVGTAITNSNAPYTPVTGYRGYLNGTGGVVINNANYDSLDFDYELGSHYEIPTKGFVIVRAELSSRLREYAKELGMNSKEAVDFVNHVLSETKSDKIFISHFSNEVSKKLLPLYFSPEPDSYTNIVFYVNDSGVIGNDQPERPVIEQIKRDGYTAVEISYIIIR